MTSWMKLKSLPPLKWNEPYPLFNRVSLETVGRCTRECVFCPARFRTAQQRGEMSDGVFSTVMRQLEILGFKGVMQLFYLGEPLLDRKIVSRIRLARDACPKAKLLITSNGDLLKKQFQVRELFEAGLNVFNVDCYDKDVHEHVVNLAAECDEDIDVSFDKVEWKAPSHRSKIMTVVDVTEPSLHRRGCCHTYLHPEIEHVLSENGMLAPKKQKYCAQPMRRLVVWWSGEVVLCCVVTPTIENAPVVGRYDDLLAAWNSETMARYRWYLQQGIKQGVCERCYYRHAFPHVVRRITKPPL